MRKIVLTFGLIAGAVMTAMFLITIPFHDQIGFDNGMLVGYTSMVAAFLAVYFGVRQYRDQVAGGTITFARALGVGLLSGGYGQDELERAGAYRVYQDPADLLRHLDEVGVRAMA